MQAGISGVKGQGAHSIIMSGSHYDDKDEGDTVWYTGTKAEPGEGMTANTELLHDNIKHKTPVRLIRSSNLAAKNKEYAPADGFRFDGLYDVISHTVLDAKTHYHLFRLERQPGQDPIRSHPPNRRPTTQDIVMFQKHQALSR